MKEHVLKAGFLLLGAMILILMTGCNSGDSSKPISGTKKGIAVKVKASKF